MILNERQIQKLKEIINRQFNAFLLSILGVDALSSKDLSDLRDAGMINYFFNDNMFKDAFHIGKERTGTKLTYSTYKEWRESFQNQILGSLDQQALDTIDESARHYSKKLKETVTNKLMTTILDSNKENILSKLGSPTNKQKITTPIDIKKLAKDLETHTKNSFKDWERIVITELNNAYSQGSLHSILESNENKSVDDILVYCIGPLDEGTCKWCRKYYHDGKSFKVYRLSELLANGTNVGRKQKDWLAVIPSMHPRCRHRLVELPQGFSLDKNGKMYFVGTDYHELNTPIKKSLKGKVPTFSGWKLQDKYTFQGMRISIEQKKGSFRKWKQRNGRTGRTLMKNDYGYIRNTLGPDGDHVDCYIGPNEDALYVYVIHQHVPPYWKFDEEKCMLGFDSEKEAKEAYLAHYDNPKFFGGISKFLLKDFKKKVLGKQTNLIKGMNGHKYIKRTGGSGSYKYWYKDAKGGIYSNNSPNHDEHSKINKIEDSHKKDVKKLIVNGKESETNYYESSSGEKIFIDKDNNEYLVDRKTGDKINIDTHKPEPKVIKVISKEKSPSVQPYERLGEKTVGDYKRNLGFFGREKEIEGLSLDEIKQHKAQFDADQSSIEDARVAALQNLPPDIQESFKAWTGGNQTGINHYNIREVQRGEIGGSTPNYLKKVNKIIKDIENYWDKLPVPKGPVYRGIDLDNSMGELDRFLGIMKPGSTFETEAFSSFSSRKSVASDFGNHLIVVHNNKSGRDVAFGSLYSGEDEVLVKKGTKYKVLKVESEEDIDGKSPIKNPTKYQKYTVHLEEIDE